MGVRWTTTFFRGGVTGSSPGPVTGKCWDQDEFIHDGYTPANQIASEWGVQRVIRAIVWHDMEGYLPGAISRWNSGAAGAHLCVLRNGTIVRTVRLEDIAWHAGTDNNPGSGTYGRDAFWRSHNINPFSIGVELEGFVASGYTTQQAAACRRIADYVTRVYNIPRSHAADRLEGHHVHSEISSQRSDPGSLFNWAWVL